MGRRGVFQAVMAAGYDANSHQRRLGGVPTNFESRSGLDDL